MRKGPCLRSSLKLSRVAVAVGLSSKPQEAAPGHNKLMAKKSRKEARISANEMSHSSQASLQLCSVMEEEVLIIKHGIHSPKTNKQQARARKGGQ